MISPFVLVLAALPLTPRIASAPGVTCPTAHGLEAALVGLLPEPASSGPSPAATRDGISVELRVALDAEGDALLVRVHDRRGRLLGERRLRPAAVPPVACAERTQEVAVIVAAATGSLRGPGALAAPEGSDPAARAASLAPPKPPSSPRSAARRAEPVATSDAETSRAPTPEVAPPPPTTPPPPVEPLPPPASTASRLPSSAEPSPPQRPNTDTDAQLIRARAAPVSSPSLGPLAVGVSLGGALSGGTLAPAATADLTFERWSHLPITVGGLYAGEHALALSTGQVAWSRVGLAVSVAYHRSLGAAWFAEGGAGVAATALHIEGRDLPASNASYTFDPGASLVLRVGHRGDRTELWIGALLSRWLRPQGAFVSGTGDAVDLARWEIGLGLGARFDLSSSTARLAVTSGRVPT